MGALPFWFEEQLVLFLVGESDQFRLDAGAITWPDTLDLTVVKRRFRQSLTQDLVHFRVGVNYPAGALFELTFHRWKERKVVKISITLLNCGLAEVNSSLIKSHRSARFHALHGESEVAKLLGNSVRSRLRNTTALNLHRPHMHQSIEESASSQYHRFSGKFNAKGGFHTLHNPILDGQTHSGILPHIQIGRVFENIAPFGNEANAVGL